MELELRVRLSERPVPPGCGQRGRWLSLGLPPVCASLARRSLTSQSPWGPDTPTHLHSYCAATGCSQAGAEFPSFVPPGSSPKPGLGWRQEVWLDEQTCLRSSESTQDMQAWGRGLSCPVPTTIHPYLDWLFHTFVEEVEGTGPLHPEGKGRSGFAHGGTGGGWGKGSAWGRGGRLMGREIGGGWSLSETGSSPWV